MSIYKLSSAKRGVTVQVVTLDCAITALQSVGHGHEIRSIQRGLRLIIYKYKCTITVLKGKL